MATEEVPAYEPWAAARVAALVRFAYLVTGEQAAAEDAVQTALAKAWEAWDRVGRTRDPDGYVRRMIVNAHISQWRLTGRVESPVAEITGLTTSALGDPADRVATADDLWAACGGLPARQRAALVLRYYEDLDYPEIAVILDCAEPTARSHVHRALAALRISMNPEDDDG